MTNAKKLTVENVAVALTVAEKRWFDNRDAETIAKGITQSADLAKARKFFTASVIEFANANLKGCNLTAQNLLNAIEKDLPVKAIMRMGEFFSALSAGDYSSLDGVTALSMLSAAYAGGTSREALLFACTGKGNEHTSDQFKDLALVQKMRRALKGKSVAAATEGTQNSRSFGKNGFCKALNMGKMGKDEKGNKALLVDANNALFVALVGMIEKASDSTLELMKGGKASGSAE